MAISLVAATVPYILSFTRIPSFLKGWPCLMFEAYYTALEAFVNGWVSPRFLRPLATLPESKAVHLATRGIPPPGRQEI